VAVTSDRIVGLDSSSFDFDRDLFESFTSSGAAFREFVEGDSDHVFTAAFVYQIQPLDPSLEPFLVYAEPATDGKARTEQAHLLKEIKEICGKGRITVGGFATDADSGYDAIHEEQERLHLAIEKS
jgi:hypothetical protein